MAYCHLMLGDAPVQIHTSDHGYRFPSNVTGIIPVQDNKVSRVFLLAFGGGIPAKQIERLSSLMHFRELVDGLLSRQYDDLEARTTADSIPFQCRDPYSENYVQPLIDNDQILPSIAHRATRRLYDLFICNALGQEFYYRLPDEQTNYIDDPRYQKEIAFLREKTGKHFIDIDANDEYIHSRKLYKSIEEKYGLKKIY